MPDRILTKREGQYYPTLLAPPSALQHMQGVTLVAPPPAATAAGGDSSTVTAAPTKSAASSAASVGTLDFPSAGLPDALCSKQWSLTLAVQVSTPTMI